MNAVSETNRLLLIVCIVFLSVGMSQGAIGPVLQDIARQTHSTTVAVSSMLTAIFSASLAAQTSAALLVKKVGYLPIMLIGMLSFLCGVTGMALSTSLTWLIVAAGFKGGGDGAILLLGNVMAAEMSKGAGPLNLVNAMFGVGAIVSPAVISAAMAMTGTGVHGLWLAPISMAAAFAMLSFWRPMAVIPEEDAEALADVVPSTHSPVLRTSLVWLVAGLCLMEVSIEISVSTWLPTILERTTELSLASTSMVLSWFWFLLTASRFVAAWASRTVAPLSLMSSVVALCILACVLLLGATIADSALLAMFAVSLLAPALGPILPTALAILRAAYPRNAGAATGIAFGSCNFGGGLVPPLLGVVILGAGAPYAIGVMLGVSIAMAGFLAAIALIHRNRIAHRQAFPSDSTVRS